jgi:U3 small nucleolar RNA-associated protein 19
MSKNIEAATEKIRELEAGIKQSVDNVNNIVSLLKYCQADEDPIKFYAMKALHRVFVKLADDGKFDYKKGVISKKKRKTELSATEEVKSWIRQKFVDYIDVLLQFLHNSEPGIQIPALTIIMDFEKQISEDKEDSQKQAFQNFLFPRVVANLIMNTNLNAKFLEEFKNKFLTYDDIRFHLLHNAAKFMANKANLKGNFEIENELSNSKQQLDSISNELMVNNAFDLLSNVTMPKTQKDIKNFFVPLPGVNFEDEMEKDGDLDEDSFDLDGLDFSDEETTKPNNNKANGAGGNNKKRKREEKEKEKAEETDLVNKKIQPLKFHRRAFTSCWLTFLRLNLSTKIYKQVLFILHERVIPHLTKPEVLMDFLKASYDVGGAVSLLALNSLFVLIAKHGLEYPDFFKKLYSLFNTQNMTTKYRARFLTLAQSFLNSPQLPTTLICSFIKRMGRLSLVCPAAVNLSLLAITYNLFVKHPATQVLIHRSNEGKNKNKKVGTEPIFGGGLLLGDVAAQVKVDPFIDTEEDPMKTNAMNSSLWEIQALMNHYIPNVASLARVFQNKFTKLRYDVEEFTAVSYQSLFEAEIKKKVKKGVPLAYQLPRTLFNNEDFTFEGWNVYSEQDAVEQKALKEQRRKEEQERK